jgi:hypothetical protein
MKETTITLNTLFDFSEDRLRAELSQKVAATSAAARLAAKNIHFSKESIAEEITGKLVSLCDVDVVGLLAEAWNKEREIKEGLEKSLRASGETEFVSLFDHTVKSSWPFIIEIIVRPLSYKIHLDLSTALTLKGVKLKVENGRVTEIMSCNIGGTATISIESAKIWNKECKPVDLLPVHLTKPIELEQDQPERVAG